MICVFHLRTCASIRFCIDFCIDLIEVGIHDADPHMRIIGQEHPRKYPIDSAVSWQSDPFPASHNPI